MFFNLIKEINRFRKEINRVLSTVFNSIKEINRLRKEINRLLSRIISNIYLKVTTDTFSKLQFSSLKNLSPGRFWQAPTHAGIINFKNSGFKSKIRRLGTKLCVAFLLS